MGISLYIPNIDSKDVTVKDLIIVLLSEQWPLTPRKVHIQIQKRFAKSCSYQAVYKALNELMQNNVVYKREEGFSLNIKWLKNVQQFTKSTETRYFTKEQHSFIHGLKKSKQEGGISILTFENLFDLEKYLYYLQKEYLIGSKKKKTICYHHRHEWRPLFYMRAEYNWIRKINEIKHDYYILCFGKTPIDKFCERFYKRTDANIRVGVNVASTCELVVIDDLVVEVYLPFTITKAMDKEFARVKDISGIRPSYMIREIFEKVDDIQVVIKRDNNIAKQIKEMTLNYFKGR